MMMFLEKEGEDKAQVFLDFEKANIIVTANHCFRDYKFKDVMFENSKTELTYFFLKAINYDEVDSFFNTDTIVISISPLEPLIKYIDISE